MVVIKNAWTATMITFLLGTQSSYGANCNELAQIFRFTGQETSEVIILPHHTEYIYREGSPKLDQVRHISPHAYEAIHTSNDGTSVDQYMETVPFTNQLAQYPLIEHTLRRARHSVEVLEIACALDSPMRISFPLVRQNADGSVAIDGVLLGSGETFDEAYRDLENRFRTLPEGNWARVEYQPHLSPLNWSHRNHAQFRTQDREAIVAALALGRVDSTSGDVCYPTAQISRLPLEHLIEVFTYFEHQ